MAFITAYLYTVENDPGERKINNAKYRRAIAGMISYVSQGTQVGCINNVIGFRLEQEQFTHCVRKE